MIPSLAGILVAGFAFVLTFLVARTVVRRIERRKKLQTEQAAQKNQSRQVRRAQRRKVRS